MGFNKLKLCSLDQVEPGQLVFLPMTPENAIDHTSRHIHSLKGAKVLARGTYEAIVGWKDDEDEVPQQTYTDAHDMILRSHVGLRYTRDFRDHRFLAILDASLPVFKAPAFMDVEMSYVGRQGQVCSNPKCLEFVDHAEPNQSDGSFKCYRCRNFPW